jgi:hypothetical protein
MKHPIQPPAFPCDRHWLAVLKPQTTSSTLTAVNLAAFTNCCISNLGKRWTFIVTPRLAGGKCPALFDSRHIIRGRISGTFHLMRHIAAGGQSLR